MRKAIKEAVDLLTTAKGMGLIVDISISPIYYLDGIASQETVPLEYKRPDLKVTVSLNNEQVGESLMHHILDNYKSKTRMMRVYVNNVYRKKDIIVIECLFSDLE